MYFFSLSPFFIQTTGKPKCHLCGLNHPLKYCLRFKEWSPQLRRLSIVNKGYCLNCLAYDHKRYWCSSRERCQFQYGPNKFCNARHHTILHREERDPLSSSFEDDNIPPWDIFDDEPTAEKLTANSPLPEAPTAEKLPANSTLPEAPAADKRTPARLPLPEVLIANVEAISLHETTTSSVKPTSSAPIVAPSQPKGAIKKVPFGKHTNRSSRQTPKSATTTATKQLQSRLARNPIEQQVMMPQVKSKGQFTTCPNQPPIVRVHLNHRGQKVYTTFFVDPNASESYILKEALNWLPDFEPTINEFGTLCGRFIFEPHFEHRAEDEIYVELPVRERLNVKVPGPVNDPAIMTHFKGYKPLGHPFFNTCREIDGVIGGKLAEKILINHLEDPLDNGPFAQKSTFGWIISGPWKGCTCHPAPGVC